MTAGLAPLWVSQKCRSLACRVKQTLPAPAGWAATSHAAFIGSNTCSCPMCNACTSRLGCHLTSLLSFQAVQPSRGHAACTCRLGCLFTMLLYLSMMSLSSLALWMEDRLLFIRQAPASGTSVCFALMYALWLAPCGHLFQCPQ